MSRNSSQSISSGMTVLELLLAVTMLLVFTGVVVMVSGTLFRFLTPVVQGTGSGSLRSNGLLIDQTELRAIMQSLVSLLEQPGISREQLLGKIAYPQSTDPDQACVVDPIRGWNLPLATGSIPALPPGYRLCVWTTSIQEATTQQLLAGEVSPAVEASPGVYVMQALPEQLTTSHLPSRLLFCRPKPFC